MQIDSFSFRKIGRGIRRRETVARCIQQCVRLPGNVGAAVSVRVEGTVQNWGIKTECGAENRFN